MKKNGFSIIELLVVMMILAGVLYPMMSNFGAGMRASNAANKEAIARHLAQEKMEEILARDSLQPNISTEPLGTIQGYPEYSRSITISAKGGFSPAKPVASTTTPDLYMTKVSVNWNDGNKPQAYELESMKVVM